MNLVSTIVTVTNSYCAPFVVSCSSSDLIDDFILMGELSTQIYDISTGCSTNSYDNRTQESVTLSANKSYISLILTQYTSDYVSIWIDFNDNAIFEASEKLVYLSMNSGSDTAVPISIPAIGMGATGGTHRMRATVSWTTMPDPCQANNQYGETHDYTVNILSYIRKLYYSQHKKVDFDLRSYFHYSLEVIKALEG